ncbi:acyl-ACP thioesterase domain-containing protein [Geofilum rubicundum]|uniref:acyl-ACP thioesterase domain-containing protein n=1 Tax=Geofilum rubicundum TaxID=472113 RepID=UPI00267A4C05
MPNYYENQFELRYFEMNKFGAASPTTILTLLEETAADHCYSINHSLYDLEKQNVGWVLLSGVIEMDRYPVYKEKITIRTWLSSYS